MGPDADIPAALGPSMRLDCELGALKRWRGVEWGVRVGGAAGE